MIIGGLVHGTEKTPQTGWVSLTIGLALALWLTVSMCVPSVGIYGDEGRLTPTYFSLAKWGWRQNTPPKTEEDLKNFLAAQEYQRRYQQEVACSERAFQEWQTRQHLPVIPMKQ